MVFLTIGDKRINPQLFHLKIPLSLHVPHCAERVPGQQLPRKPFAWPAFPTFPFPSWRRFLGETVCDPWSRLGLSLTCSLHIVVTHLPSGSFFSSKLYTLWEERFYLFIHGLTPRAIWSILHDNYSVDELRGSPWRLLSSFMCRWQDLCSPETEEDGVPFLRLFPGQPYTQLLQTRLGWILGSQGKTSDQPTGELPQLPASATSQPGSQIP